AAVDEHHAFDGGLSEGDDLPESFQAPVMHMLLVRQATGQVRAELLKLQWVWLAESSSEPLLQVIEDRVQCGGLDHSQARSLSLFQRSSMCFYQLLCAHIAPNTGVKRRVCRTQHATRFTRVLGAARTSA